MPLRHLRCHADDHLAGAACGGAFRRAAEAKRARALGRTAEGAAAASEAAAGPAAALPPAPAPAARQRAGGRLCYPSPLRAVVCFGSHVPPLTGADPGSPEPSHAAGRAWEAVDTTGGAEALAAHLGGVIAAERVCFQRPGCAQQGLLRLRAPLAQQRAGSAGAAPAPLPHPLPHCLPQLPAAAPPPAELASWVLARRCRAAEEAEQKGRRTLHASEAAARLAVDVRLCLCEGAEGDARRRLAAAWAAPFRAGGGPARITHSRAATPLLEQIWRRPLVASAWRRLWLYTHARQHVRAKLELALGPTRGLAPARRYRARQIALEEEDARDEAQRVEAIVRADLFALADIPPAWRKGSTSMLRNLLGPGSETEPRPHGLATFECHVRRRRLARVWRVWAAASRGRIAAVQRTARRVQLAAGLLQRSQRALRRLRLDAWLRWARRVAPRRRLTRGLEELSALRLRQLRFHAWSRRAEALRCRIPALASAVAAVSARRAHAVRLVQQDAERRLRGRRWRLLGMCRLRRSKGRSFPQVAAELERRSAAALLRARWGVLLRVARGAPRRQRRRRLAASLQVHSYLTHARRTYHKLARYILVHRCSVAREEKVGRIRRKNCAIHARLRYQALGRLRARRWGRRRAEVRCELLAQRLARMLAFRYWLPLHSRGAGAARRRHAEGLCSVNRGRHALRAWHALLYYCSYRQVRRAQQQTAGELSVEFRNRLLGRYWRRWWQRGRRALLRHGQLAHVRAAAEQQRRALSRRYFGTWIRWCAQQMLLDGD